MPSVYENYYTGDRRAGVNIRIMGSGFYPDLESVELEYPDGSLYSFGYLSYYNRATQFFHNVDSTSGTMVELQRNLGTDLAAINGIYRFHLEDVNGGFVDYEKSLSVDPDLMMPGIVSYGISAPGEQGTIPKTIYSSDAHYFEYSFDTSVASGTKLVFLLNRGTGAIFPAGDGIAVSLYSGSHFTAAATLPAGDYELVAAFMEHGTATPFTDATTAGLSGIDMRSENLINSFYKIYGADTGYVFYKSAMFTVN